MTSVSLSLPISILPMASSVAFLVLPNGRAFSTSSKYCLIMSLTVTPCRLARSIAPGWSSSDSRLGCLFSGEGLALLVDLHSVALDADLSRVAHSPIRQFSCPDSRHIESGTRQF